MYEKDGNKGDVHENSLENLLVHMRRVRAAIPVNQRLREELRQHLLQQQSTEAGGEAATGQAPHKPEAASLPDVVWNKAVPDVPYSKRLSRRKRWWWGVAAVLLLMVGGWVWWSFVAPLTLEAGHSRELTRYLADGSPVDLAVGAKGQGMLVVKSGVIELLDNQGHQFGQLKPPTNQSYISAAWSHQTNQLALVQRSDGGIDEIIKVPISINREQQRVDLAKLQADLGEAQLIFKAQAGQQLNDLNWSPDGRELVFTLKQNQGTSEVYILNDKNEAVSLGPGKNPTWSPDGTRLVVERPGEKAETTDLWLVQREGSNPVRLTTGQKPVWGRNGYLAYIEVKDTERVLTYNLDGSPLFSVQQRLGEIRVLYLGKAGTAAAKASPEDILESSQLLIASDNRPGPSELNWLRYLELTGVQEPRTLRLDQVNRFQHIEFGPEGKTLLIARQDGGMLVLEQIGLRQKLIKAR